MKRKWSIRNKWRKVVTFSREGDDDKYTLLNKLIRRGYEYDKGFIAISHRHGINGDDFITNSYSVVFYLMRVPRIVRRIKRKQ